MKKVISIIVLLIITLLLVSCGTANSTESTVQEWPENQYTATVPIPNLKTIFTIMEGDVFGAQFTADTIEDAKSYAYSIIHNGYSIDKVEQDYDDAYSLYAKNPDNYIISYTCEKSNDVYLVTMSICINTNPISSSSDSDNDIESSSSIQSYEEVYSSSSEEYTVNNTWPTTGLLTKIPKPSFGTLSSVSVGEGGQSAVFTGVDHFDFDTYISDLIALNFNVVSIAEDSAELDSFDDSFSLVLSLSSEYFTILASNN